MHDEGGAASDDPSDGLYVTRTDGVAVLRGEIDIATIDRWRAVVADPAVTSIDLAAVSFIDIAGVRVLVETRSWQPTAADHLGIIGVSEQARRVFGLLGLDEWLPPSDTCVAEP